MSIHNLSLDEKNNGACKANLSNKETLANTEDVITSN